MSDELELIRAYRRLIEHLAGKHNQKSHGNKYGSTDAIKANVKRLGRDKAALKNMAQKARKDKKFQSKSRDETLVKNAKKRAIKPGGDVGMFVHGRVHSDIKNKVPVGTRIKSDRGTFSVGRSNGYVISGMADNGKKIAIDLRSEKATFAND